VRFRKSDRTIEVECWRLLVDVANPKPTDQFPGWPRTFSMLDNDGREPVAFLPTVRTDGPEDPVVQVIDERSGEIVYTLRIQGREFRPMVYDADTTYRVVVGDRTYEGVRPAR
jgi:hypothetical protein